MFPVIQKLKLFGVFRIWKSNDPAVGLLPALVEPSAGRWYQRFQTQTQEDVRARLPQVGLHVRCVVYLTDYSRISPGSPRKLPGCCWRSSDSLLPPGFPSLIQLERVSTSWTMKKLMLLTCPGNFPGADFNQGPRRPCVYHAVAQHRL